MSLKENIISYGYRLGLDLIGFTHSGKLESAEKQIIKTIEMGISYPFINAETSLRCSPDKNMTGAKTIISAAIAYTISDSHLPESPNTEFKGYISRYAIGPDYHRVLCGKLGYLADYIKTVVPGADCKVFVDNGCMVDRACAQRSGIGWFSPNTCITTHKYGSWVFLGEIITDVEIEPDLPAFSECTGCNQCIEACPTGALLEPYVMDPSRCLSYITQMSGCIPYKFRESMGYRIYGCDTCQMVCPINKKAIPSDNHELMPVLNPEQDLIKLLSIDKNTFEKTFGLTAAGWRGRNIILRNAVIALGNYCDERALPILNELLHYNPSPVVRGHAAWAMAKTGGDRIEHELIKALELERDKASRRQIEHALSEVIG